MPPNFVGIEMTDGGYFNGGKIFRGLEMERERWISIWVVWPSLFYCNVMHIHLYYEPVLSISILMLIFKYSIFLSVCLSL